MSDPGFYPLDITTAGVQPTPPAVLRAAVEALVSAIDPGYTADLPGSLIEDILSTDTGALIVMDQARVELLNSLTALGSNAFILAQLGQMLGISIGTQTNTSVYCVFSDAAAPGYTIGRGFQVGDGTYIYTVQDGGILDEDGNSAPLFCVATIQGSWAVPPGTVTQRVTSVPDGINITVTNPNAGLPGVATGETQTSYQARVFQGNLAASQGMSRYLKTLLGNVSGVQPRLIRAIAQSGGGWLIMVGGGDPYEVANAIFQSLFDISTLVGSTIKVTAITKNAHAAVTTDIAHGLVAGQANVHIAGVVGMTEINGGPYTVHAIVDDFSFSLNLDSTGFTTYTSGGVVTPNARNISPSIQDYPDIYSIPIVLPLQQTVAISLTWNTNSLNFVSSAAVAQLGAPALAAYINSIPAGMPINLFELQATFQQAIASILDPTLLTRMAFIVTIDGEEVDPSVGTGIIQGDTQGYLISSTADITITQG